MLPGGKNVITPREGPLLTLPQAACVRQLSLGATNRQEGMQTSESTQSRTGAALCSRLVNQHKEAAAAAAAPLRSAAAFQATKLPLPCNLLWLLCLRVQGKRQLSLQGGTARLLCAGVKGRCLHFEPAARPAVALRGTDGACMSAAPVAALLYTRAGWSATRRQQEYAVVDDSSGRSAGKANAPGSTHGSAPLV